MPGVPLGIPPVVSLEVSLGTPTGVFPKNPPAVALEIPTEEKFKNSSYIFEWNLFKYIFGTSFKNSPEVFREILLREFLQKHLQEFL